VVVHSGNLSIQEAVVFKALMGYIQTPVSKKYTNKRMIWSATNILVGVLVK
jgi:hypothetical protein